MNWLGVAASAVNLVGIVVLGIGAWISYTAVTSKSCDDYLAQNAGKKSQIKWTTVIGFILVVLSSAGFMFLVFKEHVGK